MDPSWRWEDTLQFPPELTTIPDLLWDEVPQHDADEISIPSQGTCDTSEPLFSSQESHGFVVSDCAEPVNPGLHASRKRKLIREEHWEADEVSLRGCTSSLLESSQMLNTESWGQEYGADCAVGRSFAALRGDVIQPRDSVESLFVPVKDINPSYLPCQENAAVITESAMADNSVRSKRRQASKQAASKSNPKEDLRSMASPQKISSDPPPLASPLSPPPIRVGLRTTQPFTPPQGLERTISGGSKIYPFGPPTPDFGGIKQELQAPLFTSPRRHKTAHSPTVSSSSPRSHSLLGGRAVIQVTKIKTEGRGSITVMKTK